MADKNLNINISVRTQNTNKKLSQINTQLKQLSRGANTASANTTKLGIGFKSAFTQLSAFTGGMIALSSTFRVFSFGVSQMVHFEKTMRQVKAVTQATEAQFKSLSNTARQLGATTSFSATESAEGLRFLAMAGFSVEESMQALLPTLQLAKAGNMDLGRSADIVSNIMRAMNMEASKTAEAGDILAQAARSSNTSIEQLGDAFKYAGGIAGNLGLTLEETTAVLSTLSNAGMQASMAGTGLRQVLTKLVNPSASMREVFKSVGIEVDQLDISANNLVPTLRKLQQSGLTTGEIFSAFEARAGTAFSVLMGGIDDLEKLSQKNAEASGTLDDMAKVMEDSLHNSAKLLQSAFSELFISQNELHNGMRGMLDTLTMAINIFNGTATSVDKYGQKQDELIVKANKLIIVLKAIGVAITGAMAFKALSATIKVCSSAMAMLGLTTSATTKAIVLQNGTLKAMAGATIPSVLSKISQAVASMALFKNTIIASSLAVRGFAIALASTGIGAIVVAVGYLIGKLLDLSAQSNATKDMLISDANAVVTELQALRGSYDSLRDSAESAGTASETSFSRTAQKIMELEGIASEASEVLEELAKIKPPEITQLKDLKTFEKLAESQLAIKQKQVKVQQALNALTIGEDDKQIKTLQEELSFLQRQSEIYQKHGIQIVKLIQEGEKLNQTFESQEKILKQNNRLIEEFANEISKIENASISAEINVLDAEARFRDEMLQMTQSVSDLAGRSGGQRMTKAITEELEKGDLTQLATIEGMLEVGVKSGDLQGAENVLPTFKENVEKTRAELLELAGGADKASKEMIKAITQLAVIDELGDVKGEGGIPLFEFINKDAQNAGKKIEIFKRRLADLREVRNLQATIEFNDESKTPLAQLESNIAKAKLEIRKLNLSLEETSRISGKGESAIKSLGNVLNQLGIEQGQDTSSVHATEIEGLEEFKKQVDDENKLTSSRIANALRGVSAIERINRTRRALVKTEGEGQDDFGAKFESTREAFVQSIKNGGDDVEGIVELAMLAGIKNVESKSDLSKIFKTGSLEQQNQLFQAILSTAQSVRVQAVKQGVEVDNLESAMVKLSDLERQRSSEIEKQNQALAQQQQTIKSIASSLDIKEMEANLALGAGNITQADIDLAKFKRQTEVEAERFGRNLKNAIDKATESEIAIKRTELIAQGGTKEENEKALAEFKEEINKRNNDRYEELIEKQKQIFESVTFVKELEKSIESFEQQTKKFQDARKARQEKAEEFINKAKDEDKDEDKGTREAGVSSLAKIGGGGGVGRGGGRKDTQTEIKDINAEMLKVLNEIARKEFGVEFKELEKEDQEGLAKGAKRIAELVQQKRKGGEGLNEEEGLKAIKNIGALLAQTKNDQILAEVGNLKDLANLGEEIKEEKPTPFDNDAVKELIKNFRNANANNQVLAIKKLEEQNADPLIIEALKREAQQGEEFQQPEVQKEFSPPKKEVDLAQQKEEANNQFKNISDLIELAKIENKQIDEGKIEQALGNMVGEMDHGAQMLAERLQNELDIPNAMQMLARERVDKAVEDTKGSDLKIRPQGQITEEQKKAKENFIFPDLPPLPPLADMPEEIKNMEAPQGDFQLPDPSIGLTKENRLNSAIAPSAKEIKVASIENQPLEEKIGEKNVVNGDDRINETNRLLTKISKQLDRARTPQTDNTLNVIPL